MAANEDQMSPVPPDSPAKVQQPSRARSLSMEEEKPLNPTENHSSNQNHQSESQQEDDSDPFSAILQELPQAVLDDVREPDPIKTGKSPRSEENPIDGPPVLANMAEKPDEKLAKDVGACSDASEEDDQDQVSLGGVADNADENSDSERGTSKTPMEDSPVHPESSCSQKQQQPSPPPEEPTPGSVVEKGHNASVEVAECSKTPPPLDPSSPEKKSDDVEILEEDDQKLTKMVTQNMDETVSCGSGLAMTADSLRERLLGVVDKEFSTKTAWEHKLTDVVEKFLHQESVISPLGVRKIVESADFRKPKSVCLPPSQVVYMLSEYEAVESVRSLISTLFGENAPNPDTIAERKHKTEFRANYPAPHFTRLLYDIGLQLAQECTYSDIVHMKNLPKEMPRNEDTISKVIAQVKPYLEMLKTQTVPYKLQLHRCSKKGCRFKTDSEIVMDRHSTTVHLNERRSSFECGLCTFETRNREKMTEHYREHHKCTPEYPLPEAKAPCPCCSRDFQYKNQLQHHLRECKKSSYNRFVLSPNEDDRLMANRWLWPKPPPDLFVATAPAGTRVLQVPGVAGGSQYITATGLTNGRSSSPGTVIRLQRPPLLYPSGVTGTVRRPNQPHLPQLLPKTAYPRAQPPSAYAGNTSLSQQRPILNPNRGPNYPRIGQMAGPSGMGGSAPSLIAGSSAICEICDQGLSGRDRYYDHLQMVHKRILNKTRQDFLGGAPLACSRCQDRFWTYEGLERHLVMSHGLVTSDLLQKAQGKLDAGRCQFCNKQYAFNLLQHLVVDHKKKLCSAEILYSCDVCTYQCTSYQDLERHLSSQHASGASGPLRQAPKRPLPPSGRLGPVLPPPKTMRMGVPSVPGSRTDGGRVGVPPGVMRKPQKVRYTCTPCALKFSAYSEVIAHWQERHLMKVKLHTCRVDRCDACRGKFDGEGVSVDWELPEKEEMGQAEEVICLD